MIEISELEAMLDRLTEDLTTAGFGFLEFPNSNEPLPGRPGWYHSTSAVYAFLTEDDPWDISYTYEHDTSRLTVNVSPEDETFEGIETLVPDGLLMPGGDLGLTSVGAGALGFGMFGDGVVEFYQSLLEGPDWEMLDPPEGSEPVDGREGWWIPNNAIARAEATNGDYFVLVTVLTEDAVAFRVVEVDTVYHQP